MTCGSPARRDAVNLKQPGSVALLDYPLVKPLERSGVEVCRLLTHAAVDSNVVFDLDVSACTQVIMVTSFNDRLGGLWAVTRP